ncbi:YczE/YyaS/YitT family protein [Gordonia sp. NPDC003425]
MTGTHGGDRGGDPEVASGGSNGPDDAAAPSDSTLLDGYYVRRVFWSLVGIALIGLGSATLRVAKLGVDPYTAANIGISNTIGMDLGTYQLISNVVLFIPMLFWGRKYIGVGSILNMVLVGYFIQWFTTLLDPAVPDDPSPLLQLVMFVIGIGLFAYGGSLYMTSALGNSPYDAIAPMIVDHAGAPYRAVRVIQDLTFLVLAVVFHGQIGPGTVVTAFFAGPLIDTFTEKVNKPLMRRDLTAASARRSRIVMGRSHF